MFDEQPDDNGFDAVIARYAQACQHMNKAAMREGYIALRAMCEGAARVRDQGETQGCTCHGCHRPFKVDLLVRDDVWKRIRPAGSTEAGGLLCPFCIVNRLVESETGFACWRLEPAAPLQDEPMFTQTDIARLIDDIQTDAKQYGLELAVHRPQGSLGLRRVARYALLPRTKAKPSSSGGNGS